MPIPLQVQLFDAFLGSQQGIHSIILPDVFSSGGSQNLWIDKYGRAKKVSGFTKQNSTAVTTDTGASATLCRALFPFRSNASAAFTRRLIGMFDDGVNEAEIWSSTDTGATWTFVQDLGAGSIGSIPDFAQLGNVLIFTNGVVAPRSYDGTTWATAGSTQLGAPTPSAGSSGNLRGHYNWKLVPFKSDGTRKIGSVTSAQLLVEDKQVALSWTADADTDVVGYELYRTTGVGAIYYFVEYIDGRTTVAFTDNKEDDLILENRVMEEHGDAPPSGAYKVEAHKQRMWYFRTDANTQTGWWSDPGDPDSVYTENNLTFSDATSMGDVIVGAEGDYEGKLVVFQERSVWSISGTGDIIGDIPDWSRVRTNAGTGTVSGRAVVRIPAGSKFVDQNGAIRVTDVVSLAYFTPLGDIRLFDGDNDLVISHPLKDICAGFNYAQRHKIVAVNDPEHAEAVWIFPYGSAGEPDRCVVWNYRWGVWYERDWDFSCLAQLESSSDASVLLGGSNATATGGHAFLLWNGNSNNGTAIDAQWMTKTLYGVNDQSLPALSNTKRWRWADFMFETEQTVTLTVEWLQGNSPDNAAAISSTSIAPAAADILTADGDFIASAGGDTLVVSEASAQVRALLKTSGGDYLHDEGIRLRVGDNASNGSWSLEAFALGYQILPGLKRRMQ